MPTVLITGISTGFGHVTTGLPAERVSTGIKPELPAIPKR